MPHLHTEKHYGVVNKEANVAFTIFALDSLLSFLNFATDLPRANLCKSIFSPSNISTPNRIALQPARKPYGV